MTASQAIGAALVALCDDEVRKQISMDKYKTAKSAPTPLVLQSAESFERQE